MSTWIFLRGLTREARHWGGFADAFKQSVDAAVVMIDLPGNGRWHRATSPCTVEAMMEHCRAELRRQNIEPPYRLLALSLGAMVAVAWAARYPGEAPVCVLINASMRPFSAFHQRLRPRNYAALLRLAFFPLSDTAWETEVLRLTSNRVETRAVLRDWVAYRRERPVSRGNALRQLFAAARFRAPASKPPARMLIVASSADALVDPQCSRRLAAAWHADIVEHPTAGHDLSLDDGLWLAQRVSHWLRSEVPSNVGLTPFDRKA